MLARASYAVVLTDARLPALLALASRFCQLADARTALLAPTASAIVLTNAHPAALLTGMTNRRDFATAFLEDPLIRHDVAALLRGKFPCKFEFRLPLYPLVSRLP